MVFRREPEPPGGRQGCRAARGFTRAACDRQRPQADACWKVAALV